MVAKLNKPLIAIVGPTATGKSDLAIKLAKKFNCEIVSADSWLVRRHLDIGTAKPSIEQRNFVPHHMIDIVDPCENYSAARYKREAQIAIDDIYDRGRLPILVGGTGLYVDAILYNFSFLPSPGLVVRQALNGMSLQRLHQTALSKGLDLGSIDSNNKRRVIRLIETNGMIATKSKLRNDTIVIGVSAKTEDLKKRITKRVDDMINAGLKQEVEQLSGIYGWGCEALKGIGYSEWLLHFKGNQSIETTRERIIKDTYELAKRQQTWFKKNKSIHWYPAPVKESQLDEIVTTFLSKNIFL